MPAPAILVVDDDADIRALIAELLRLSGFEIRTASSGEEALQRLASEPLPSLALLDVQMPGLDGWDTLRAIRASEHAALLPVVLCTVESARADLRLGWTLGCDGYVVKPFAIADLVVEVDAVLARDAAARLARRGEALGALAEDLSART